MTSITIPDGVTNIGYAAFAGCSSLTSITIPDGVTSIGDYAFAWCSNLTSITIPSSVISIGYSAFNQCNNLTNVTIPEGVTSIDNRAFYGCNSLTEIAVDAGNPNYKSIDGVLFNKDGTQLIQCPAGKSGEFTIPDGVASIGEGAFGRCGSLVSIIIPDSVTSIGDIAFYNCISLTSITILDGVTSIGDRAFEGCSSLAEIIVGAGNPNYKSIDGVLLSKDGTQLIQCPAGKSGEYTIPDGITNIGSSTFYNCISITSITIPDGVTSIGDRAFYGCSSLESVYFFGNAPSNFGWEVFEGTSKDFTVYFQEGASGFTTPTWEGYPSAYFTDVDNYTITFDTDGGTAINPITQEFGTAVIAPSDPTKTGYTFAGWDAEIPETMPAENMTITALWTINQYTITFDVDGLPDPVTQDYGTAVTAPADPTKVGYTFAGWDTEIPETMPAEEMIITALWTINQYTITFDTDGGSAVDPITQDYDSAITVPSDPTKTGYTFAGWDTEIPETMPAENITVTALWTINTYTVTFKDWDGDILKTETVDYGSGATAPADPQRDGYTFTGWSVAFNSIAADLIVTAQYSKIMYTITFDTDGGTAIDPITQEFGTAVIAPSDPTKTGYTFAGWDTEIPETMPAENITVTALWTINTYTVTFKDWDGNVLKTQEVEYGSAATAPSNPTRTGYNFIGWDTAFNNITEDLIVIAQYSISSHTITFVDADSLLYLITQEFGSVVTPPADPTKVGHTFVGWASEIPETMPAEDMTITALWTINSYSVTFKDWDGNVLKTQEVDYGSGATAPADPQREGYTFTGWSVSFINITSELDVIAEYSVNQYTITFDTDGGTAVDAITQDYASVVTAPVDPTKIGYTFAGWDVPVPGTMPAENITITALWTINTYTVTFKDWDGSILKTETVGYGSAATAPADPSRDYYTFTDWSAAFSNIKADLEVTAQYLIDSYTVSFNSQGGSSVNNKSADYNTTITAPTAPSRTGYTFGGWYKEASCINAWIFASDRIIAETTLYAKWTIKTYTVSFNSQGGSSVNNKSADYNTTITAPTVPTRSGYTFLGWYKEAAGTNEWNFAIDKVTTNSTLYAKWQSNAPENITSDTYTVNNTKLYVSKIKYETTISAFMNAINEKAFVKAYKGTEEITGTAFICTGMLIKIIDGATVKKTYTAVVTGDINGDGKVTLTDFVQLKSHILGKSTLTGAYASAADLNGDGKITLTDFVKAKAHLLNKELITPQAY